MYFDIWQFYLAKKIVIALVDSINSDWLDGSRCPLSLLFFQYTGFFVLIIRGTTEVWCWLDFILLVLFCYVF